MAHVGEEEHDHRMCMWATTVTVARSLEGNGDEFLLRGRVEIAMVSQARIILHAVSISKGHSSSHHPKACRNILASLWH